ncbi:MAG: hypothetical protein ACYCSA_09990 [Thermoplasmataceae archaeon]
MVSQRIPYHVFISPPLTARDFYRQRRRWLTAIVYPRKKLWNISRRLVLFPFYRYIVGWTSIFGIGYVFYLLIFGLSMPVPILAMSLFNTASYFAIYQYGAFQTNRKYSQIMLLFQYAISIYEGTTLWYALIYPPDTSKFDVIRKAAVSEVAGGSK